MDDVTIHFKKRMATFSEIFTTVRDDKDYFYIIIVEVRKVYVEVEIIVIDKGCILCRFAIEFRGFYDFWLFSRDYRSVGICRGKLAC